MGKPPYYQPGHYSLYQDKDAGNVGNTFSVLPSDVQDFSLQSFGNPLRVLQVVGDDNLGGMQCVSIQQETVINQGTSSAAGNLSTTTPEGPLVGIAQFGAGSSSSSFEFDIPTPGTFPGSLNNSFTGIGDTNLSLPVSKKLGGVFLTLPASALYVLVRNDANAPFIAAKAGSPGVAVPFNPFNKNAAQVRVHATYGRRPSQSFLTRSYPICGSNHTAAMVAGDHFRISVPTYAKRVFFPRTPMVTSTLGVIFEEQTIDKSFRGSYTIAAGSQGPLDIMPYDTALIVTNPLGGATITDLIVVFELGV